MHNFPMELNFNLRGGGKGRLCLTDKAGKGVGEGGWWVRGWVALLGSGLCGV